MNFLLKSLELCSCNVTDQAKVHEKLQRSISGVDPNADAKGSKVGRFSSDSASNPAPTRDLEDTGEGRDCAGSSGDHVSTSARHTWDTERKASAATADPAMTTTIAAEALLALRPQPRFGEEEADPDYPEAGKTGREVASSGTPVAPRRSSDSTQAPVMSRSRLAAAWQMEEENESRVPLQSTTTGNGRDYKLSEASSSAPRPPRGHLAAQCFTRKYSTGPTRGTALLSPPRTTQHEVLMPVSVAPKSKFDRFGGCSSVTSRTNATSVSTVPSTSRSVPTVTHEAAAPKMVASTTSTAVVPTEASSLRMHPRGTAMDLVRHADRHSFRLILWDMFQRIDFTEVQREFQHEVQHGVRGSPTFQECRRLFRIVAKKKDSVTVEDLHELLAIFTPCGLSLREVADFLSEKCRGKSCLTFHDFLQYGPVLRARLKDYELFEQLSDRQKLIATHARVLPGKPPANINTARLNLLRLVDQQMQGRLPRHARALRVYEEMFLIDYQERLHDAELIPANEVPPHGLKSDYAHEYRRQQRTRRFPALPQLSVPALLKEDMEWRRAEVVHSTDSEAGNTSAHADASEKSAAAVRREEGNLAVSRSSRSGNADKGSGKAGKRKHSQRRHRAKAASNRRTGATYGDGSSWVGLNPERTEVDGQRQLCLPQHQKKMGRFIEEEYWERRTMDDHLITQLQSMYRR